MKGFTLIETIIYIALVGLFLSGMVLTSYQLLQGSSITSGKTTLQDEGGFALRKLDWALESASNVSVSGSTLTITRYDSNTVVIRLTGTALEMRESAIGTSFFPITTSNVKVSSATFQLIGSSPKGVTVTINIKTANGTDSALPFVLTKYLPI